MTTSDAPLKELLRQLQRTYSIPAPPLRITSEAYLRGMLDIWVPEHHEWGKDGRSKPVEYLINEFIREEAEFSIIELLDTKYLLRDIRTVTIDVTFELPAPTTQSPSLKKKLKLKEYHKVNGKMMPRQYDNSMSEKLFASETDYLLAVHRALTEELGIMVREEHLLRPFLFPLSEHPEITYLPIERPEFPEERDVRTSGRYPGVLVRNQLQHFIWLMPSEYFNPQGYHEEGTNHYFSWKET